MSFIAYETSLDYTPDVQYVNEPRNTMEYYAWRIGLNEKYALWMFKPAVTSPTQDLVDDILPEDYQQIIVDDDLQKYGFFRTFLLDQTIADVEQFFTEELSKIESFY